MATKKVLDMTARSSSSLAYNDFVYLTKEVPLTDEKMQASVMRDYVLSGIKTNANSGLAQTSTAYAFANPDYELSVDVNNLTTVGGTASTGDYIAIDQGAGTKKLLVGDLPFASSASSVASITGGDGITASSATGAVTLSTDLKANGGVVIESAELAIDLAASSITGTLADGDIASAATWNAKQAALTFGIANTNSVVIDSASVADNDYAKFTASGLEGRTASETKTDLSLDNVENTALSTWAGSTNVTTLGTVATGTWNATAVGVTKGGTGLTTVAKGSVLAANAADTISAVAGVTNGHVLTYTSASDTVGWAAPGHITSIEGTSVLSTSETGTAKFLRIDGDNSCSWQVPPDVDTTYSAGNGLDLSTTTFSVDLTDTTTFTSANTVSKAVVRDGSGDFAAGTVTADLTGDVTGESILLDGNKNITPGDGSMIHVDTSTLTDNVTAISGTATKFTSNSFEGQTLAATNASVTTTDAATVYISGPTIAGTNETLTRTHALWVDSGNARFDGSIYSGTTEAINSSGLVTVANQSNITGVSTITSGTWNGTEVGLGYGGTELVGETDGKIVIADGAGAPVHLDVGSSTGITILGTVATGVWNGTAIDGTYIDLEGTEVKSTGETGGTKFLREDGDNSCSWQTVPAAGVTAGFSIAMAVAL